MKKDYYTAVVCFLNKENFPDAFVINLPLAFKGTEDEKITLSSYVSNSMNGQYLVSYSTKEEINSLSLALELFNETQEAEKAPEKAPEKALKKVTVSGVDFMFPVDFDCSFDYIPSVNYDDNGNPENLDYDRVEEFLKVIGYLEPENSMIAQIEKGDFFILGNGNEITKDGLNGDWLESMTYLDNSFDNSIWYPETNNCEYYFRYNDFSKSVRISDNTWLIDNVKVVIVIV